MTTNFEIMVEAYSQLLNDKGINEQSITDTDYFIQRDLDIELIMIEQNRLGRELWKRIALHLFPWD